ncbi:TlpA family protein disulfide reductase [Sphingobium sufflavum]|uniref:TlpA family protein disulfide reductase n=1 Tax=Sphingobium sufflavum TaxID=1129547 RepID=UPI001F2E6256|nr:TlpA disulfide reductase family protein [Sphingobium sufflavum]MCE7795584.1 TlpA family protein disulfide reductase [Sphingobium sufflavum]
MTLLLLCGMTLMTGGCDRRSGENGQGGSNAAVNAASVPLPADISSGEVPPAGDATAGGDKGAFTAKLDRSHAGADLPDLIFTDPAGKDVTLDSFRGRPVLVNLWATWCGPCVAEMPMLDRLAAQYKGKGLAVLTVSQDTGEAGAITAFFARNKLPHLAAWRDPENGLGFHYATGVLPTTVLYDREGKEVVRVVGAKDWSDAEGRELIEDLVD